MENPDIETWYYRGARLKEEGDLIGAERCFRQIVDQHYDLPDPQHSLGVVLQLQGRFQEAIKHYRAAIAFDPGFVKAHYNLANACLRLGLYADAADSARATLQYDPEHANAHWLLGMLLLQQGDFENGWQEYEWRWKSQGFTSKMPELGRPQWDGSPLTGKTLLIHMEQGRGDMIQFVRYASQAAATGGRVIVSVLPELVSLLTTAPGVSQAIDREGKLPDFDVHAPAQSLPYILRATLDTIPANVPYLSPDLIKVNKWQQMLPADGKLRIGLAWQGTPAHIDDHNRSCPLTDFMPIAGLAEVTFYSLQLGYGSDQISSLPGTMKVINLTNRIHDFSDTAALITNLDLVICVDTAVAHLSGALGKPVWALLPYISEWRWLLDREDTPWYPSMRLFRQSSPGDWAGVMSAVQKELAQLLDGRGFSCRSGIDLLRAGNIAEAERLFAAAATQKPDDAEVHCNHGVALDALGHHDEAIDCYRRALLLKPDYMQAVHNMGNAYISLGKQGHAQRCFEHALELVAGFAPAHLALGEICKTQHDFSAAFMHFRTALEIDPSSVDAFQGVGEIHQAEERYPEAITAYQQALALEPHRVTVLNMLGDVYQCIEQPDNAERLYRKALALEPERATVLNNLGVALIAQGKLEDASAVLHHLIEIQPDYAEGHWNLSMALLAAGNYLDGWWESEWRFKKSNPVPERGFEQPRWDGSPLNGKTILLHAEQGFGDTIQFARYVPLVVQRGGRVIVECQVSALKRLLHSISGVAEVVVAGNDLPFFDCHLPMLSLPLVFGTTPETIPSQVPYLVAEPADVEAWHRRLGPSTKYRVGLVWFAKQSQVLNRKRSCPLQMFAPLWAVPGVEFYALQVGMGAEQLKEFSSDCELIDLTHQINDFADTAAFMANLDLVITIDTVTAHLAGALGVQTWVVLPYVAEWRWLCQREDSPWYPGMRLFRQPSPGDWPALMDTVATALRRRVNDIDVMPVHPEFRVGVAWSGRQDNPLNCKRSCPFTALAPLFDLKGIIFVNLQMDATEVYDKKVIDLTSHIRDFEDTAALMANLDLIISIDTSIAHLAAATGRPTWVLLSHVADWRWSPGRKYSLWYPEVEIFRQPDFEDWDSVIREVTDRLSRRFGGHVYNPKLNQAEPDLHVSEERSRLEQLLKNKLYKVNRSGATPDDHLDVGAALSLLGRDLEAADVFRHVLELDPEHVAGHLNLAYSLLAIENYSEAWGHLEWRLKRLSPDVLPPWPMLHRNTLGTHPAGSTVLVHCEQGYGDTIQFSRFLPLLAEAGYRVIVSCQPPMATLIASIRCVSQIVAHGELLPVCDLQVSLLSLPGLFSTAVKNIPAEIPYLMPQQQRADAWKSRLDAVQEKI